MFKTLRLSVVAVVSVTCLAVPTTHEADGASPPKSAKDPQKETARKRRIILNDDGEVIIPTDGKSWDKYLAQRFTDAVGTQVDTYFLNIAATDRAAGIARTLQSSLAYWASPEKTPPYYVEATRRYIDSAHRAGMEIFASIRLNDTHDSSKSGLSALTYPLKVQHPEVLIDQGEGLKRGRGAYGGDSVLGWYWNGLNYAKERVRKHFLGFIADYCPQYDYDGLELDFYRSPRFFKVGEDAQHMDTMTDFVRQVRGTLNKIGKQRGRPYLLAVRVPETPTWARRVGLDVERWLKEKQVDMIILGGGYMPYGARIKEFIDLAHRYDVPAYACMNRIRKAIMGRSVASNFWALGADGVYVFNWAGVPDGSEQHKCLKQMGDPDTLLGLDKRYLPDNGDGNPIKGWRGMVNRPRWFPIRLTDGDPIELVVGDDLQKASQKGLLQEMRLSVFVDKMGAKEGIDIWINDAPIPQDKIKRVSANRFQATVSAPPLKQGINQIVILPGPGCIGRFASAVTGLELSVRYKH